MRRVRHGAAEGTGVQVDTSGSYVHIESDQAAHADAHRRDVGRPHTRVRYHDDVAVEEVAVALEKILEVRAADLLLALDEELQVDRQGPILGQKAAGRFQLIERLALVVDGAAGAALAVDDD